MFNHLFILLLLKCLKIFKGWCSEPWVDWGATCRGLSPQLGAIRLEDDICLITLFHIFVDAKWGERR
jgi:hypothetical protein